MNNVTSTDETTLMKNEMNRKESDSTLTPIIVIKSEYSELNTPKDELTLRDTATLESPEQLNSIGKDINNKNNIENINDIMYSIHSFWAIVTPVAITMIIASFVVVNYRSTALQASMSSYLVYKEEEKKNNTNTDLFGKSLINALVVIGFVTILTFAMVLLYKYNCMKLLIGYIMFASSAILGFEGGQLVDIIMNDNIEIPMDWPSFLFIMYNFSITGVISIFYQKGSPKLLQKAYLVLISVILAWQFSMWPEWTTWIFCSMFAIYDLCAVLTPCGPLKCLINLIQEKQAPMPGLLYEAEIEDSAQSNNNNNNSNNNNKKNKEINQNNVNIEIKNEEMFTMEEILIPEIAVNIEDFEKKIISFYEKYNPLNIKNSKDIAKKYHIKQDKIWEILYHKYQICSCKIGKECTIKIKLNEEKQNIVHSDDGIIEIENEEKEDKTIKLGLGDFIFYSVLVGRAAIYDYSTFLVTFVSILMGLGMTLFLLSVLHKALPALPISIFLSTLIYFWTRTIFIEYINIIAILPSNL